MAQHWSVDFLQEIIPHHDLVIGCYSDEVPVIGGMVDFAERKAVVDHGLAAEITVGDNMGYIQQLGMAQPAKGALAAVSLQHPDPERPLVQAHPEARCDVAPTRQRSLFAH